MDGSGIAGGGINEGGSDGGNDRGICGKCIGAYKRKEKRGADRFLQVEGVALMAQSELNRL